MANVFFLIGLCPPLRFYMRPLFAGSGGDRVQWTKQGAVRGAVLQFLQGHSCPKKKLAKQQEGCCISDWGSFIPPGRRE